MRFFPTKQSICRIVISIAAIFIFQTGNAQVNVAGSIGANGTYPTLTAAFTAINSSGPQTAATIVLTITASTNEGTGTAMLNAGTWTTLTIQPAAGVAATVTGTTTGGNALIKLNGADNVTIDGLNTGGSSLTITNPSVSGVAGTSTILFKEGATNNVITNCTIRGAFSSSVPGGGTIYFSSDATTTNGNDNNVISNNAIGPVGANLPSKAITSVGATSTMALNNSGNVISGNTIFDYFISAGISTGVYLGSGTTNWTIQNNKFFQTSSRTLSTGGTHAGILLADAGINNCLVNGNTIGYSSASGTGTYTVSGGFSSAFYPIYISAAGTAVASTIQNNTVTAILLTGSITGGSGTAPFSGILINSGVVTVSGNMIGSATVAGAITISANTGSTFEVHGILNLSPQSSTVINNSIGGISVNNSATTIGALLYCVRVISPFITVQNNTIGFSAAPIVNNTTGTNSRLFGINTTTGGGNITGNTIAFLQNRCPNIGTDAAACLIGIYCNNTSATSPATISQNHIHSLSNINATASINAIGIFFAGSTSVSGSVISQNFIHSMSAVTTGVAASLTGIYIYSSASATFSNNMISLGLDETGSSVSNDMSLFGIREEGGTNQFYFNSIYIGGSGVTGANATWAFYNGVTAGSRDIRNNIFYNGRSNGTGTGKHYAIFVAGTTANPPGLISNYNDLFANGTGGVLGLFNGSDCPTLPFWRGITGQDLNSQNGNPNYVNPAGNNTTTNLHINTPSVAIDGTGTAIAGITDDYDSQIRAGLTPTDIGADAGNFLPLPILGTYPNTTVMAGKNTTVTPSTAPVNTSQTVAYSTSDLHGVLAVNPTTGVATITDVMHAGTYLVTVKATGTYGSTTTNFTLTITSPNCSQGIITGTTNIVLPGGPQGVVVADFNNDGNQDIATANNSASTVSVRLGNGAGGFTGTTDLTGVGTNPRYLAAGDFDGDGNQDIVNSAVSSDAIYISLGDGLGGFFPALSVAVASFPTGVSVGDFNNDGKLDIATGTSGNTVSIRLGNGFGGFTAMPDVVTLSPNWTVGIGDFNEDGKQDLAITSNNAVLIRLGDGAGNFTGTTSVPTGAGAESIIIADFNHDNHQDFAISTGTANTVSVRLGDGLGGFSGTTEVASGPTVSGVAAGDFNGDGNVDLAISRLGSVILIRYGDGLGNFSGTFSISGGGNFTRRLAVGDFNNDGFNDVVAASETVGNVAIRLGGANEINVTGNTVTISDGDVTPAAADFTNFGVACSGSVARTFTIQNTGTQNLSITGVTITGTNASDFVVTTAPASTITTSGTSSFVVTFTPGATGLRNATITIANNDCDEASYDFAISGTGTTAVTGTTVVTNVSCFGGSNGTINLTPAGGGGGYTFNWLPSGPTTEDRTGLTAGTYSVLITDVNGCSSTVTATVTQPTSPVSGTTVVTNVACNGGSNGAINLTPTGGSSGYTFNWLPSGPTTEDRTGLTAGTYSVLITDVNGCTGTVTATVTQPPAISVTASSQTNVSCNGGSNGAASINAATGGSGGFTYNWTPGNPTGDGTTSVTGLTAGTWIVTTTDLNGCTATSSFTVTQPPAISVTASSQTNVSCNGGSNGAASINAATGGSGGFTYNWTPGNPTGDGTTSATGLTAGTWIITTTDINGCTATSSFTVTQPPAISVTASSQTNVSCNGGSNGAASINAATGGSGGFTYNWTPGNPTGDGTTSATGLTAGTWIVTTTDLNGCTATSSFTVTQPPAISVTASSQTNVSCNGGSNGAASINAATGGSGGFTYNWTPGNPTGDGTTSATGLTAGTWIVTTTDLNGCTATSSFTVTQPPAISVTASSQTNVSCNGGSNGAASINAASGGTGGFTYDWSPGNPTGDGTTSVSGLTAGPWSVTATDANGCSAIINFTITEPSQISVTASSQTNVSCFGGNNGAFSINAASGGTGGFNYDWSPGNPTGDGTTSVSGLTAGPWSVTATDANGCSSIINFTITEPSQISVTASSQTNVSCFGGNNGAFSINAASGGTGGFTYDWSPGNPTGDGTTSVSGLTAGPWSVTATDANGCSSIINFTITEPSQISVTASSQTNVSCFGGNNGAFSINAASGGTGGFTYDWSPGNPTGDGTTSVSGLTAGPWSVTATDANGCSAIINFTITEPSQISVTASSQTNVSCFGSNNGAASINAASGGSGGFTYDWSPGNPTGDGTTSVTGLTAGTWMVTTTDINGCTAMNAFTVTQPPVLTSTSSASSILCNGGNATVTVIASGGISPYTGEGTFTETAGGPYSYTVTDNNGCTNTTTITITEPTTLTASSSATSVLCNGGNATVTVIASGGTSPYTGEGTFTETAGGPYSYTVTDNNGCTNTTTITITEPTTLTASSSATSVLCNGGNATVTVIASGGTSPYTGEGTFTETAGGPYSYTVTDNNGCTNTTTITITEPTTLTASSSATSVLCNGGNATVTVIASGGTSPYTGEGTFTETASAYSYTVTDNNGCTNTTSITITEPPVLSASVNTATNPTACGGTNGSIDIDVTGGTAAYTFFWSNNDTNEDLVSIGAGSYNVIVTDANGCTTTTNAAINDPGAPVVTLTLPMDTACGDFPGIINLSGESPAGGIFSGTAVSGNTFDPFAAGIGLHYITYTFTNVSGCTGSTTDSIYVSNCLGIQTITESQQWNIFPNPTNGTINITTTAELNSNVIVEIYSVDGKLIRSENKQQTKTITLDMSTEPVGVYFIHITANDKVSIHKVVKI